MILYNSLHHQEFRKKPETYFLVFQLFNYLFIFISRNDNEADAVAFLERFNTEYAALLNEYILLDWVYNTNLTEANSAAVVSLNFFFFNNFSNNLLKNIVAKMRIARWSLEWSALSLFFFSSFLWSEWIKTFVLQVEVSLKLQNFSQAAYEEAAEFEMENFTEDTVRQLKAVGAPQLEEDKQQRLTQVSH